MGTLQLEVVTPDKTVVSAEVEMAVCPGVEGEFGVLPQHVSMLSALKIGDLRYRVNGKDENVFISGGFADVNNNVLSVRGGWCPMDTNSPYTSQTSSKARVS